MDTAIIFKDQEYTYKDLEDLKNDWLDRIIDIPNKSVVMVSSFFNPSVIGLLYALMDKKCIAILVNKVDEKYINISTPEFIIESNKIKTTNIKEDNKYYNKLREIDSPGMVFFSSGSSGNTKAVVHDYNVVMKRFKIGGKPYRSILFLAFDHFGGINTLFNILSNKGCAIIPENYQVSTILKLIEKHKIDLLPTTPSFLNLMLLSGEYKNYDLSFLKLITYGTEPMLENVLNRLNQEFPNIRFQQTYGLTELGVFKTRSLSNNSLLVKIGGDNVETKIVDGTLYIKTDQAMMGYLNAPDPFTEDGWMNTQDKVEEINGYYRIYCRDTEIINVGGLKVFPNEIENLLMEIEDINDVVIYGKSNKLIGQYVCALIKTSKDLKNIKQQISNLYYEKKIDRYKMPIEITLITEDLHTERFKKRRKI
jgi:long-chain acyl-CoA synthetase